MTDWSPQNIHTSMRVYTLDGYELGHIAKVYEDSFQKRPDYEHHLGDPTQLFYDRGHGVHDPFDEANSDQT